MIASPKVAIADYGCGNLFSIQRALQKIGSPFLITKNPEEILTADKLILPGVGSFKDSIENIRSFGLFDALIEFAKKGKPVLGICLGMQLFMDDSFEFGHHAGLGLIPGIVRKLSEFRQGESFLKVPHIGWNTIDFTDADDSSRVLLSGISGRVFMYFIHSFCVINSLEENCLATTEYGNNKFCSIIRKSNILGVQFHPEISGEIGLTFLRNFIF